MSSFAASAIPVKNDAFNKPLSYFNADIVLKIVYNQVHHKVNLSTTISNLPYLYNVHNISNPQGLLKPVHTCGIIHDYLSPEFNNVRWESIQTFDQHLDEISTTPTPHSPTLPPPTLKDRFHTNYSTTMQGFQTLMQSLLLSFTTEFDPANPLYFDTTDNIRSDYRKSIPKHASGWHSLPYPIEQSALMSTLPQLQRYLCSGSTYTNQQIDTIVNEMLSPAQSDSTAIVSPSMRFHYLILSLYTCFYHGISIAAGSVPTTFIGNKLQTQLDLDHVNAVIKSTERELAPPSKALLDRIIKAQTGDNSILLDPAHQHAPFQQFPILTPQYLTVFLLFIQHIFAQQIVPFEDISPLTINLLLDIYAVSAYYILNYFWMTSHPDFSYINREGGQVSLEPTSNPFASETDPFISYLSKETPVTYSSHPCLFHLSNLTEFMNAFRQLPTIEDFLTAITPSSHLEKVTNLYLNHAAFYIQIEADFIQRTFDVKLPDSQWKQPPSDWSLLSNLQNDTKPLMYWKTVTSIDLTMCGDGSEEHHRAHKLPTKFMFNGADFQTTCLRQSCPNPIVDSPEDDDRVNGGKDKVFDFLAGLRSVQLPADSPYMKNAVFKALIQKHIDPIFFPTREMNMLKTAIQKYSGRFQVTDFTDITSILSNTALPLHHRYLAVGFIARLFHMNRRFEDLSILLTKHNIAPINPLLLLTNSIFARFQEHYAVASRPTMTSHYHTPPASIPLSRTPPAQMRTFARCVGGTHLNMRDDLSVFSDVLGISSARGNRFSIKDSELRYIFQLYLWLKYNNGAHGVSPFLTLPTSLHYFRFEQFCTASDILPAFPFIAWRVYSSVMSSVLTEPTPTNIPIPSLNGIQLPYRSYFKTFSPSQALGLKKSVHHALVTSGDGTDGEILALDFELNQRLNPHFIEALISAYTSINFTNIACTPFNSALPHMLQLTMPQDIILTQFHNAQVLLRDLAAELTPFLRTHVQKLIQHCISNTRNWFEHFSTIINFLHKHQDSSRSLTAFNHYGTQVNLFSNAQSDLNREVTDLQHNFLHFAIESALSAQVSKTSNTHPSSQYNLALSPIPLPNVETPSSVSLICPLTAFLHHDQLVSTFALLLQDIFHINSTLESASQVFSHFYDTIPHLQPYFKNFISKSLQQRGTTAQQKIANADHPFFVSTYFLTPTPLHHPPPTTAVSPDASHNFVAVQFQTQKYNLGSHYSLNMLFLYNTLNPFIQYFVGKQLQIILRKTLYCGAFDHLKDHISRLQLAQALGSAPSFETFLSSPFFFPQFKQFGHAYNDIRKFCTPIALHDSFYPDDVEDVRYLHISPIDQLLDPTTGLIVSEYSLVDNPVYFSQLCELWQVLYSSGLIHAGTDCVDHMPFKLLPQMLHNLTHALGKQSISPLTYNISVLEPSELNGYERIQQNYSYELTHYTTPNNLHLRLFNLITMQSLFLPPTLPYFAPSLFTSIIRIAMNAVHRVTYLWLHNFAVTFQPSKLPTSLRHQDIFAQLTADADVIRTIVCSTDQTSALSSLIALTNKNILNTLDAVRTATEEKAPPAKIRQLSEQLTSFHSLLRVSVADLDTQCGIGVNLFLDHVTFFFDLLTKSSIPGNQIARIEPYEYVAMWLCFGNDEYFRLHDLTQSAVTKEAMYTNFLWSEEAEGHSACWEKSPVRQLQNEIEQLHTTILSSLFNTTSDCAFEYNCDFIFNLVTYFNHKTRHQAAFQLSQLLVRYRDFSHFAQDLLTVTVPFIPLTQSFLEYCSNVGRSGDDAAASPVSPVDTTFPSQLLPEAISASNLTMFNQAMAVLDADIPAFCTPWNDDYTKHLDVVDLKDWKTRMKTIQYEPKSVTAARAPNTTPLEVPIEPVRHGLLYFLLDSTHPSPTLIDEVTWVCQMFQDADRCFVAQDASCDIQFFLPPSAEQIELGKTYGQNISLSLVDAAFLRGVQKQTAIAGLTPLFSQLTRNILDYTIVITRPLRQSEVFDSNFSLQCTVEQYITALHPDASSELIQNIKHFHQ